MKSLCVIFLSFCLLTQTFGIFAPQPHVQKQTKFLTQQLIQPHRASPIGMDVCTICLQFMDQGIDALLQFIVQAGIGVSCQDIAQAVADRTGSAAFGTIIELACTVVGLDEFVKILQRTDIDDILYCEDLKACPVFDHGDAKFTMFDVSPKSGPRGEFDITFQYSSTNGTGTGQIVLDIDTVDGLPVGQGFLHEMAGPGTYNGLFKLKAEKDPNCDPSEGPCERWEPGNYTVKIAICNGECGSKHPHSKIYDEATAEFVITKKND